MPNASCSTLATGARQFVVHDAFEMMWWLAGVVLVVVDAQDDRDVGLLGRRRDDDLLRPGGQVLRRIVAVGEEAGGLEHDVHAERFHGSCAGSFTDSTWNSSPSTVILSPLGGDVGLEVAEDRVVLEQVRQRLWRSSGR